MSNYRYLDQINTPDDLKSLPDNAIPQLNDEIRDFLVSHVQKTGGHLASNLGVVELSVALLRVFHTPCDRIIWDVGHQAYVHKLLTGRRNRFDTLRTPGGLSGFTKRGESEYDPFGAGHSSTSLSAALGFAKADRLAGRDSYTIAVLGDGAYTGGMIHEALNNCDRNLRLIIILNENEMSISKNIGSFARYIARVRSSKKYMRVKRGTTRLIRRIPLIGKHLFVGIKNLKKMIKNILYGSNYFEELGLFYIGPADGNDYFRVEQLLRAAIAQNESVIIHLKTKKGKGYAPAEENPKRYHSLNPGGAEMPTDNFSSLFGHKLCELAERNTTICAITAAMTDGTGLAEFRARFPERFFDVGIAEEHGLTFSAGLAAAGMRPFIAVYSSFLQRGYDNLLHDIALQGLPVTICVDRAGLSLRDGATHHGIFDVAFLSEIPGLELFAPITSDSLEIALTYAATAKNPVAIRYPNDRDRGYEKIFTGDRAGNLLPVRADYRKGYAPEYVIVTYGRIVSEALRASKTLTEEGIRCGVILLEWLKPYEAAAEALCTLIPPTVKRVILLEEGIRNGGAAMILFSILSQMPEYALKLRIMAIDNSFVCPDHAVDLLQYAGISAENMIEVLRQKEQEEQK